MEGMDSAERHPAPVALAVVLGLLALLAVAELASRLIAGSTVRAGLAATASGAVRAAGSAASLVVPGRDRG